MSTGFDLPSIPAGPDLLERAPIMAGKRGLIMGIISDRSIAWGIAKALHAQGAELGFTFERRQLYKRVRPLAERLGVNFMSECDVANDADVEALLRETEQRWGRLDFLVHAIASAGLGALNGKYINTTRADFQRCLDISCFSFTTVCRHAARLMPCGGSLLTLTYYGAEKVIPHYNVMGVAKAALEASVRYLAMDLGERKIRVNAISAGPIKTVAASGIRNFRDILKWNEVNAPLRRNVTIDDVGKAGLYLLSDLGGAVTGEVHHVDCGYHILGMNTAPPLWVPNDSA